jgi:hypothetical protein
MQGFRQHKIHTPITLFVCLVYYCTLISCANILSPTGGPRDSNPPILVKSSLPDSSVNFTGGTIYFDFDEFVEVKELGANLVVTPFLKKNPIVTSRKRRVKIEISDSLLEKNTTYQIFLGEAVRDIHEGNIYKDLRFTFSTGTFIDSLTLQGRIIDAVTGKPDTTCAVLLYAAEVNDSAFLKQKPMYVVKAIDGIFQFKNLPKRGFRMYALQDVNKSFSYDVAGEKIAFFEREIHAGDTNDIILYSFQEEGKKDTISKRKVPFAKTSSESKKPLTAFTLIPNADTSNKNKRTFSVLDTLQLKGNRAIKKIEETKCRMFQDDIIDASATIRLDTMKQAICIETIWSEDALYKVVLQKGFAIDSIGTLSLADTFYFRTKRKSDYGFLRIRTDVKENRIVTLSKNLEEVARQKASDTLLIFSWLVPDNYEVRMIEDANANGKWDTGNLFDKRQPEMVNVYPGNITIKANWENKIDIREEKKRKK